MVSKHDVEKAYRRHFEALRDSAAAHNAALDELAPPFSQEMPDADFEERHRIGRLIQEVQSRIELELGDPYQAAIHAAMKSLRADRAAEAGRAAWKDVVKQAKEELKGDPGKEIVHPKPGPKEWRPGMIRLPRTERIPRTLDDILENIQGPYLYVMFNGQGRLDGWTIDFPDYWQGHGGPTAAVPVHGTMSYKVIESEIRNELGQAEIDWEAEEE